jgi:hypothetical protein
MPWVIAGTASDLSKTVAQLVKELLENNWPTAAFDPLKADIGFGLDTWDNYGDIDIHVNADNQFSRYNLIGGTQAENTDHVAIRLYVRKNIEEIPTNMGNAQRKIEEIIRDNVGSLGQGIHLILWDGWDPIFIDPNLMDVWQAVGRAHAIYWKNKS